MIKNILLLFTFIFINSNLYSESDKTIIFNMTPKGYAPFMILGEKPSGIMYDVLEIIASKYNYQIEPTELPKMREIPYLKSGKLDAFPQAKEWVKNPEKYIFTDIIINLENRLFYLKNKPVRYNKIGDLFDKRIGTVFGYRYPLIDKYIEEGKILRSDSYLEIDLLEKVLNNKIEMVLINKNVGLHLLKQKSWKDKFQISKRNIGKVGYRILFSKKLNKFVTFFNKELKRMKKKGTLKKIINKYK